MTLLVQGMRRSGTTILYDALLRDEGIRAFYEPHRENTVSVGGGSDAHEFDVFEETRELRERFAAERYPDVPIEEFNWGGPRKPALEVGPELPEHCRELVRFLVDGAGGPDDGREIAIKFTRMYDKLEHLAEVAPGSGLVHVVRDPRAVAASMMFGRRRHAQSKYPDVDAFFDRRTKRKLWSSRGISRALMRRPEFAHVRRPTDVVRVLMVWRHSFESSFRDGRRLWGNRYVLVRNEDLRADPPAGLARAYSVIERDPPADVLEWAEGKVKPPEEPYAADDPRWGRLFATLGMTQALDDAGYPELAERAREEGGPARLSGMLGRAKARLTRAID